MPDNLTQQLLPFPEPPQDATLPPRPAERYQPTEEAIAAFKRLEGWLVGPRGPVTELAQETLPALAKALLEGKNGFFHQAEDGLEALKIRNGKTEGDDIPAGLVTEKGDDFQADVEAVLDCLHERMLTREL